MLSMLFHREKLLHLAPSEIVPNPAQPRRLFTEESLQALAESIRQHGILQPLTVRRVGNGYELIAGERRLRAAELVGLATVPCVVHEVNEEKSRILALVENIQRQDLHFLEEAAAIAELIQTTGHSQEQTARQLGYSQSAVANKLRLLKLSTACCILLRDGGLTERHARAILKLSDEGQRIAVLQQCIRKRLSVSQTEALVERTLQPQTNAVARPTYVLKDVRLFLNSLDRHVSLLKDAGVGAEWKRQDSGEDILVTIRIPKAVR